MTPRRTVTILVLMLVIFGVLGQIVRGTAATPRPAPAPRPDALATTATPRRHAVARTLVAVQRAFNAGDVRRLCRPGALVDPAVVRQQNSLPGGCEGELEGLIANQRPVRLTVRRLAMRRDLASATVRTRTGSAVSVDLVRGARRWLLSFSGDGDPMPALVGAS